MPPLPESHEVYVFGVRRERDSKPWFLAFEDKKLAEDYPDRCTFVETVPVKSIERQP